MTQDTTTSGTGRNVVYTLKVETDPGAKAELQKFKQSVQEVFKELGAKQAEARDQAMRGPQIPIERMQTQVQQEMVRRQHDSLQHAEELNLRPVSQTRQSIVQVGMPNHGQNIDSSAGDTPSDNVAPTWAAGPHSGPITIQPASNVRGTMPSHMNSGDRKSSELQRSISAVISALTNLAQALGSADHESNSRRNALLQRANRDAAFG